jgi:hypothetical protein
MLSAVVQRTAAAIRLWQGRRHASGRYAMRSYLKALAIIASLLGTYLALLPLVV